MTVSAKYACQSRYVSPERLGGRAGEAPPVAQKGRPPGPSAPRRRAAPRKSPAPRGSRTKLWIRLDPAEDDG